MGALNPNAGENMLRVSPRPQFWAAGPCTSSHTHLLHSLQDGWRGWRRVLPDEGWSRVLRGARTLLVGKGAHQGLAGMASSP